ncbi:hypothetical protein Bca4012_021207 [Brassica carinata]
MRKHLMKLSIYLRFWPGTSAPCRRERPLHVGECPFHVYGNARSMYMKIPVPCIWERSFSARDRPIHDA